MLVVLMTAVGFFVFCALDTLAYDAASYPERTRSFGYKLPGGGFVALARFGRDS
jgi:hypothetical protein